VLSELVEEAHRGYQNKIKPYVTIFLADSVRLVHIIALSGHFLLNIYLFSQPSYGGSFLWNVKRKPHRPVESIILPGTIHFPLAHLAIRTD
jgi:hypothetical protein